MAQYSIVVTYYVLDRIVGGSC